MRYFLDTEFIESGPSQPLQLISIGLVSEDSSTYYAISSEFDPSAANEWVRANVLPLLESELEEPRKSTETIARDILDFVEGDKSPEFWGYFADYDWVVFCQLFGTMADLPRKFPQYCRDLKQWADDLGVTEIPFTALYEHDALADAWWNSNLYTFLSRRQQGKHAEAETGR